MILYAESLAICYTDDQKKCELWQIGQWSILVSYGMSNANLKGDEDDVQEPDQRGRTKKR